MRLLRNETSIIISSNTHARVCVFVCVCARARVCVCGVYVCVCMRAVYVCVSACCVCVWVAGCLEHAHWPTWVTCATGLLLYSCTILRISLLPIVLFSFVSFFVFCFVCATALSEIRMVLFFFPKRKGDEGFNQDLVESGIWPVVTSSSTNQLSDPWKGFTPIKTHDWPATKRRRWRG